ncbi:MAG: hypothetical protein ACRDQW_00355 [Haloechinothrix sp.]
MEPLAAGAAARGASTADRERVGTLAAAMRELLGEVRATVVPYGC